MESAPHVVAPRSVARLRLDYAYVCESMMKRLGLVLGFLAACSSGALPELPPVATEFTPNQVQIIGVWSTDSDE